MRQVSFVHAESGQKICLASVAETFFTRFAGLQGRRKLACDAGIWLLPTRSIHTFGMRFAIDAVALDGDLCVVGLCLKLQPWRVGVFSVRPHSVLELPAGRSLETGLRIGDALRIAP